MQNYFSQICFKKNSKKMSDTTSLMLQSKLYSEDDQQHQKRIHIGVELFRPNTKVM